MQEFILITGLIMAPSIIMFAYIKRKEIQNRCGKRQCPVIKK